MRPACVLELTMLFVTTSDELFTADAPLALPVMVQLSTTRLLPYDAMTPVRLVLVTTQFLTSTAAPRIALIPKVPPLTVKPAVPPSMTARRDPSNWIAGWFGSAATIVAGATPLVLIVTSSRVTRTFSVQIPLTVITSCLGPAPPPDRASACLIVWPALQLTVTASAATGSAAARPSMITNRIDKGPRRRSALSMLFLLQPAFGGCSKHHGASAASSGT